MSASPASTTSRFYFSIPKVIRLLPTTSPPNAMPWPPPWPSARPPAPCLTRRPCASSPTATPLIKPASTSLTPTALRPNHLTPCAKSSVWKSRRRLPGISPLQAAHRTPQSNLQIPRPPCLRLRHPQRRPRSHHPLRHPLQLPPPPSRPGLPRPRSLARAERRHYPARPVDEDSRPRPGRLKPPAVNLLLTGGEGRAPQGCDLSAHSGAGMTRERASLAPHPLSSWHPSAKSWGSGGKAPSLTALPHVAFSFIKLLTVPLRLFVFINLSRALFYYLVFLELAPYFAPSFQSPSVVEFRT